MTDDELIALGIFDPNAEGADDRRAVYEWLISNGATWDEVVAAARTHDRYALNGLRVDLLLRAPTGMGPQAVADTANISVEQLSSWWEALGLGDVRADNARFARSDVRLAQLLAAMTEQFPGMAVEGFHVLAAHARQLALTFLDIGRSAMPLDLDEYAWNRVAPMDAAEQAVLTTIPRALTTLVDAISRHAIAQAWSNDDGGHISREQGVATAHSSIVFVDLVDYTRLSQRVDGTELSAMLSTFERDVASRANASTGRLLKFAGDGAMLSMQNDRDAVRIAVDLVTPRPDLPPRRAGVASGRVIIRQGDLFGPVVNLAARLCGVGAPGEVVVDHAPDGFDSEQMDQVVLKGYDDPVTPYRVRP